MARKLFAQVTPTISISTTMVAEGLQPDSEPDAIAVQLRPASCFCQREDASGGPRNSAQEVSACLQKGGEGLFP